jgi:hypothetical protein
MIAFLAACAGGDDVASLGGTITASTGESGELASATAFGVETNGRAGVMVSPNPDSTCADAASYFGGGGTDFNPEVVSGEGVCNLYIRVDDYDGSEVTITDLAGATVSLNCAMDSGSWAYDDDREYPGYYYSGPYWVGSPSAFTLTLSGGGGEDLSVALEMDSYTGRLPYDDVDHGEVDASGSVSGSVTATWCDDMAPALN